MSAGTEFLGWTGIFALIFTVWIVYEARQYFRKHRNRYVLPRPIRRCVADEQLKAWMGL